MNVHNLIEGIHINLVDREALAGGRGVGFSVAGIRDPCAGALIMIN